MKIFDTTDFGYREIKVLRPLKLRFEVNAESLARLDAQAAFRNLAVSKKKAAAEKKREEQRASPCKPRSAPPCKPSRARPTPTATHFTAALEAALKKAGLEAQGARAQSHSGWHWRAR